MSRHPWDERCPLPTGAGRLRECKLKMQSFTEWELSKTRFCEGGREYRFAYKSSSNFFASEKRER